ncbi:helix-turn-helix domain-containing protein [uncultured Bradyrhizobium sp.]|uniref:helix-turn-helix domain-containing protein n=1 Tax=uncultured Bradyrhizobium sp. TaxID=199684 RepID=UPI0035CA0D28
MSEKHDTADIDALIGERVRSNRIHANISQNVLGEALGVTFQQVQDYETGADRIGAGRLLKIAEVLECDVVNFFDGINGGGIGAGTPFAKFMSAKEGVALVEAMLKIENPALRRMVIDIAEKLAER